MKQSYAVPHGPQELCVQLFDELCFPDEEFCEQRVRLKLTLNDTSQLQRMRSNRHCIDFVLFCFAIFSVAFMNKQCQLIPNLISYREGEAVTPLTTLPRIMSAD